MISIDKNSNIVKDLESINFENFRYCGRIIRQSSQRIIFLKKNNK